MCHHCWYGYNTPKWKAFECSVVLWRRNMGKNKLIDPKNEIRSEEENAKICKEWESELLPYDSWFETEECLNWARKEWPKGNVENAIQQSRKEHSPIV